MDKEEFVEEVIKGALRENAYDLAMDIFNTPAKVRETGFTQKQTDVAAWYSQLSSENQDLVKIVVRNSISSTIWRFLFTFSDQSIGRIRSEHGMLELYYRAADGTKVMLSGDPEELEKMHDLDYSKEPDSPDWICTGLSPDCPN